jgi:hypothetical protein
MVNFGPRKFIQGRHSFVANLGQMIVDTGDCISVINPKCYCLSRP